MKIENEVKIRLSKQKKKQLYRAVYPGKSQVQKNYFVIVGENFIRFRAEGEQAFITIKGEDSGTEFNQRQEVECEIPISFFKGFERMLSKNPEVSYYKKSRAKGKFEGSQVYFDTFFGQDYVEIEGHSKTIREFIQRYDLDSFPREKRSYLEMLEIRNAKNGEEDD